MTKPLTKYKSTWHRGMGYTIRSSCYAGIASEATYFGPKAQTFEYWRLKLTNKTKKERKLSVSAGTSSWAHHTALQWICGVHPEIDGLRFDPCIPKSWPGFKIERVFRGKRVKIEVKNPAGVCKGVALLVIDGKKVDGNLIPLDRIQDGTKVVATLG